MVAEMNNSDTRVYALDALRGLAALSIVFWHWQHFYQIDGPLPPTFERSAQPLYSLFWPFYEQGDVAVDFFFAISGYVFFHVYRDSVEQRLISSRKFWLLRLSRLYPLYFATLILIATLQFVFVHFRPDFFVYKNNNATDFILNLLVIQQWNVPSQGLSFNGPTWSISVEFALYLLFYVLCRYRIFRSWRQTVLTALCGVLVFKFNQLIGRGIMGFYIGGSVFLLMDNSALIQRRFAYLLVFGAAAVAWCIALTEFQIGWVHHLTLQVVSITPIRTQQWYAGHTNETFLIVFVFTVIPTTIAALALLDRTSSIPLRHLSWVGEISYSSYLLHFPVQLAIAILMVAGTVPIFLRESAWFLIGFYAILTPLSLITFRYFERPVQNEIRRRWSAGQNLTWSLIRGSMAVKKAAQIGTQYD